MNFHPILPFRGHPARRFHALAQARRARTREAVKLAAGLAGITAGIYYLASVF